MVIRLNLAYLPYDDIRKQADDFLRKHSSRSGPPLRIEEIVDLDLEIDIVPVSDLLDLEIDGFIASDLTRIYVDQSVYSHRIEHRYRFTLAHEIGHMVLHRTLLERFQFRDLDEYRGFIENLDDDDNLRMEEQARCFAGLILVPAGPLDTEFREALADPRLQNQIEDARQTGLERASYLDYVSVKLSERIARKFLVSKNVVQKRMKFDGLTDQIP